MISAIFSFRPLSLPHECLINYLLADVLVLPEMRDQLRPCCRVTLNFTIGITRSKCPLLNDLISIGKLYLWDGRKKQVLPNIEGFKFKVRTKYQVEKYISTKNNKLETFMKNGQKTFPPFN